jgi:hypothetical protein
MLRAAASLPHSPRSVKPFQASLFSAWLCGPVTTLHPYGFCWLVHSLGLRIQSDVSKALGAPDFWNDGSSLGASQPRAGAAVDDFTLREATAAPYMSRRAPFEVGSSFNHHHSSSNHSTKHSYRLCTSHTAPRIALYHHIYRRCEDPRSSTQVTMCGGIFSTIFYEIFELWDMVLLGVGHFMVKTGL